MKKCSYCQNKTSYHTTEQLPICTQCVDRKEYQVCTECGYYYPLMSNHTGGNCGSPECSE